jgi:hypothetical protein
VTPLYLIRKPVRLTAHYEGLTEDPVSVSCIIHEAADSE